jgi:hypothetical protein
VLHYEGCIEEVDIEEEIEKEEKRVRVRSFWEFYSTLIIDEKMQILILFYFSKK